MKPFLLAFLLMALTSLQAQYIVQEEFVGWKNDKIELHTFTDKYKQHACSLLATTDSIKGFYMNEDMKGSKQFDIPRKATEQIFGGFFSSNKIYIVLDNGADAGLHVWTFDIGAGKLSTFITPFEFNKDRMVDRFSCGDHFVYCSFNKRESEFIVYDLYSETKHEAMKYKFTKDAWKDIKEDSLIEGEIIVDKVDGEGENNFRLTSNPKKIYFFNDTIHLLLNNQWGKTNIYSFDLANQKVSNRTIDHEDDRTHFDSLHSVQNSFLLNNLLYYVQANSDSLDVQVIDFLPGKILRHYTATKNKEITFKNTPIVQDKEITANTIPVGKNKKISPVPEDREGKSDDINTSRELDKTRQLLRKMVAGKAVVQAMINEKGQVELMIGSYDEREQNSGRGGGGMWVGGGPTGQRLIPTGGVPGGYSQNLVIKSAHFKMLLEANTGAHISGEMEPSINEKIEPIATNFQIPLERKNLISCNGKYYFLFYDLNERKLLTLQY